ncbi:tail fiber domain-containing protein [Aeromonas salmonicida]|uniref:pyocin knob domain-containing S74 family peptidase n=1 Tax=Aeromonas salmonicida TaxID=645 RepID=UPI003D084BA8
MAQENALEIVKSSKTILTPYNIEANKIKSNSQIEIQDSVGPYAQRLVTASGITYLQGGKNDRDVTDQKMMLSGWYGTPLSQFRISMASGIQPQVYQGGTNYDILHRGNMPTPEDIKAMAIYDRPSGDDCNNAILPGNYGIFANTANTPHGIGPSGSTLLVTRWGNGANAQIFFTYGEDRVFVRRQYVGVWKPWFELYSTSNKPSPADIGAVSKTGDTMSGALTTTQVNATNNYAFVSSIAQTHGMYLGNNASDKRLILGGGNPTIGAVHIRPHGIGVETSQTIFNTDGTITNGATPSEPGHLTNKVYVDGQIAQQVSKSGDTMTGQLIIQPVHQSPIMLKSTTAGVVTPQYISGVDSTGAQRWYVGQASGGSPDVLLYSTGNLTYLRLEANQISFNKNPISTAAQGAAAGSLVRRDFLETSLSSQTPNNPVYIGASANLNNYQTPGFYFQDSNANAVSGSNYPTTQAGSLVVTNAAGIIQEYTVYGTGIRYIRTFYNLNTTSWSPWAMTYDTLRPPGAAAVGALPIAGGTLTGGYLQLRGSSIPMLELHLPGQAAAVMYLTSTGQFRLGTGNGAGGETNVRMTVEPNGNVYSAGSITSAGYMIEGGARVYSPNNPPPAAQPSDIRLKSNLVKIDNPLARCSSIDTYAYDKLGKREVGVVAQDIERALPEAVETVKTPNGDYLGVNYGSIASLAIAAINELNQQVKELRDEVEMLKAS